MVSIIVNSSKRYDIYYISMPSFTYQDIIILIVFSSHEKSSAFMNGTLYSLTIRFTDVGKVHYSDPIIIINFMSTLIPNW